MPPPTQPTPSVGPTYSGTRVRIENPAAGRASRNVRDLVPSGFRLVENHGSYIIVERVGGQAAPPPTPRPAAAGTPVNPGSSTNVTPTGETWIWLNGQMVRVTIGPNGELIGTPQHGEVINTSPPTAFGALDGEQVDPDAPYLVSNGATNHTPGTMGPAQSRSVMTIEAGVQNLAAMASNNKPAYQQMLDRLLHAGYLSRADYAAAGGQWSAAVGTAFSLAARDVAVVNTTQQGVNTTLIGFLDSKQGVLDAAEAAGGAGGNAPYQPITRAYTDPEAIKASAKSQAEAALGRKLSDAEENELLHHFRGLENAMYDAIDAAGTAGNGGGTYTRPDATGQIDSFLDSGALEQEQANWSAAGYGEALLSLFGVRNG